MAEHRARILAVDVGGTMTDTFIVDELGRFVVGKAQSTPEDESIALIRSAEDALRQWRTTPGESFLHMVAGIYAEQQLAWNPEGDMADVEIWEILEPLLYLGRRIKPNTAGPGKYRGGSGFESLRMVWKTDDLVLQNAGDGQIICN